MSDNKLIYHLSPDMLMISVDTLPRSALLDEIKVGLSGKLFLSNWIDARSRLAHTRERITVWKEVVERFRWSHPLNQFDDKEIRIRWGEASPVQIVTEPAYDAANDRLLMDVRIYNTFCKMIELRHMFELPPGETRKLGYYYLKQNTRRDGVSARLGWKDGHYHLVAQSTSLDPISELTIGLMDGSIYSSDHR